MHPDSAPPQDRVDAPRLEQLFTTHFGASPRLFRAPGRINIIGEHTDYNDGFALPAAVDRHCLVAAAPNNMGVLRVQSRTLDEEIVLPIDVYAREGRWSDYVGAVAAALRASGVATPGCDLMIASDVPLGGGASSSAALEVAVALALLANAGQDARPPEVAHWTWEAEFAFVGAPCGPMDQFASVHGRAGHALLMDCRSLTAEAIRIPDKLAFLLIDSGVKHAIVDGGYEARRASCAAAAAHLGVAKLRDAKLADAERADMPETLLRRARHVISENDRAQKTAAALRNDDARTAGRLMSASHASLRNDFDVTCPETDAIAAIADETEGVFGARQMGGGFGGCVVALAEKAHAEAACAAVIGAYRARAGREVTGFSCALVDGAGEIYL